MEFFWPGPVRPGDRNPIGSHQGELVKTGQDIERRFQLVRQHVPLE